MRACLRRGEVPLDHEAAVAPGYHTDKFFHGSGNPFGPGDEAVAGLEPANHPDVAGEAPLPRAAALATTTRLSVWAARRFRRAICMPSQGRHERSPRVTTEGSGSRHIPAMSCPDPVPAGGGDGT